MNDIISLSYSALNTLHEASHQWVNKQMGLKIPDYPFLAEGKHAHRLIQDHVSGKKKRQDLKHIKIRFPIVEEVDFDERCKFSFPMTSGKSKYLMRGFYDGRTKDYSRILEIKSSSTPWSMGKFRKAVQRKIYGLSNTKIKEAYLITCARNVDKWEKEPPKIYKVAYTPKDYSDAIKWITDGINILLKGDFTGGLDKKGKCTGCFYNMSQYPQLANCNFL